MIDTAINTAYRRMYINIENWHYTNTRLLYFTLLDTI